MENKLTVPPVQGFVALREVGKGLRKLRWKEGDATTALGDDLLIYTLVRIPHFSRKVTVIDS